MRKWHTLKPNHATDFPQQCIWFDTETYQKTISDVVFSHHLKFGYACYMDRYHKGEWGNEKWIRFETRSSFWEWVCSLARKQTKLYLFCHNTSFDLPVLDVFQELHIRGYLLRSAIIDAPPTILRFRRDSKCIMIIDSLNIWRMPLKFLGEEIGIDKLKMPDDNDLGVDWESYGKRDVEILRDAFLKWFAFLQQNDYGSFAQTLAGQSMRAFRHKYMKHKIIIDDNERALSLTREGYHGARCECFRIGHFRGKFRLLDVNSMYPAVMANNEFPRCLVSVTRYAQPSDLSVWLNRYAICARIILRTTEPFAPVNNGSKLVFPIGEFECILSSPEIRYALEHAEILEVKECALYDKAYLFTHMMTDLYRLRIEARNKGDRVIAFMYRKMINSFYGKWGQMGNKWLEESNVEDLSCKRWFIQDGETGKISYYRQLGGLVQIREPGGESRDSFPAIAGHVTAYARMKLFDIIRVAGSDNVYYCDTDSVLVNEQGARNLDYLVSSDELGKLSMKGIYDDIQIWGAKDYRFGSIERHKGVRKDAVWITDNKVSQLKWAGLRGLVSSGIIDRPITTRITKHLSRTYDKGVVLSDGRVLPLQMDASLV